MPAIIKLTDQNQLVSTKKFPEYAHFPFENFNPVQSRVFEIFDKDCNVVIAAATSAGKTVTAEMIASYEIRVKKGKVVYLAPMKALAKEKLDDWRSPKHHFGNLKIAICTGDYRLTASRKNELNEADLIVMTSEMLNSRLRNNNSEHNDWLKEVSLLVVDESHLLTVPSRGDHLEVGLMKFSRHTPNARLLLLSATMPNVSEIADWTSYVLNGKQTYMIESTFRPCQLGIHYELYESQGYYEDTERAKVEAAMEIIEDNEEDHFLVFAHTKRTGEMMRKSLAEAGKKVEFHSADLNKEQRETIEKKFRSRELEVLVATSTLAWGCYKEGTLISMSDGSLKPIEKVIKEDQVLSLDKNSFVSSKIVRTGEKIVKNALEITLSSGEKITVSPDHPVLAAIGRNSPEWIDSNRLNIGDYVAVPAGYKFLSGGFNRWAYLLGYILGDGCLVKCGQYAEGQPKCVVDIAIDKNEVKHIEEIRKLLSEECDYPVPEAKPAKDGVMHLRCNARQVISRFFGFVPVGRKGDMWTIPAYVTLDRDMLRSCLQGLFDTDGGVEDHGNGNWSVGLTSISEPMIRQARHCLLTFGIRAEIGKKRIKSSVINGRLQLPRRKWIWRLRIYNTAINLFSTQIGFRMQRKQDLLQQVINNGVGESFKTDILPARSLICEHADKFGISCRKLCKSVNLDKWNSLYKQDLQRETVGKIISNYPCESKLKDLFNMPVIWKRVKEIDKAKKGKFYDLEVEGTHNYIGDGVISHNCNLPARRVIVLGVHRGMNIVDTYDIWQMVGRSGRPGYDPRGDAYILLPKNNEREHIDRIEEHQPIVSRLLDYVGGSEPGTTRHYKTLAFHLVSEIHHGNIKTKHEVHEWYKKSLACFQSQDLADEIVDDTLESLIQCGAIKEENGNYKASTTGVIASMFYYSPFDVADLRRNFKALFNNKMESVDWATSMCLGDVDSYRLGIVSKADRSEMNAYGKKIEEIFGAKYFTDAAIKSGYMYYCLMNGRDAGSMAGQCRGLQFDFPRTSQVLKVIDSLGTKWGKEEFFKKLEMRIAYGVEEKLVHLCQIADIGKVRATRLYEAGIKTPSDVVKNKDRIAKIAGVTSDKAKEICESAEMIDFSRSVGI